ncbi:MAG TPA: OmpA family protein [Terriglobales bacterium]|nr:OmpA family protein [Terriglobales bacterium]
MATPRSLKTLSFFLLVPCFATAQKYTDPDSPAVAAAAQAALAHARVITIVGVSTGIQSVLEDLKAKVTEHEIKIELDADVLFDFDKYSLRAEAADSLREVGEVAKNYAKSPVLIEGYTDGKGTHPYNLKLSDNRAASVKQWLVENAGISGSRITTRGWGEAKPVAPNTNPDGSDNPAGRQKNRRVEITITTS